MIDWSAFNWEAFSTLATGLAAVAGAIYIGRRQVLISDRQSQILNQQMQLDDLRLRSELFDRRFEVYEAASRFLGAVIAETDRPERAIEQRFLIATDASKFLFRRAVHEDLTTIWRESCAFFATKAVMRGNFDRDGHYGDGLPEREMEQITQLHERLTSLSDVFGDELKLSAVGDPHGGNP